jgi:DNA primase catalytic core
MGNELKEIIRQVKDNIDIVEVVGRSVVLKKAGASFRGLCPFHHEKSPSFHVVPAKGIFHCFGCGVGGSMIDFVMKSERLEFIEALEKLARELGLELPRDRGPDRESREADQKLRTSLQAANEAALAFFRDNLNRARNPLANAYLPERGLSADIVDKFQLGASLDDWDALKRHLVGQGFGESLLIEAGLLVRGESGRVYDKFRNRLMFPILDANGKVVAFGGRIMVKDKDTAKYMNSPETALYKKGSMLYALNWARPDIEKSGYAILCEGYMDVITAHAHGHTQAVASLGTAFTRTQAKLLKRSANRVYFLYDGDAAGQKAMLRAGEPLLEAGFDARIVSLPAEDDPDTFLRTHGGEALKARFPEAKEYFDFAIAAQAAEIDATTMAGQAALVEAMAPLIAAIQNDVMREGAIARLLRKLGGLPREAITRILAKKAAERARTEERQAAYEQGAPDDRRDEGEGEAPAPAAPAMDPLERRLLKLMLESHEALEHIRAHLRAEWILDGRLRPWILFLIDNDGFVKSLLELIEVQGEAPPGEGAIVTELFAWDTNLGPAPAEDAQQMLRRLQERYQRSLTHQLLRMIDERALPDAEATKLLTAIDHESRTRFQESSRHLRAKDSAERKRRMGG